MSHGWQALEAAGALGNDVAPENAGDAGGNIPPSQGNSDEATLVLGDWADVARTSDVEDGQSSSDDESGEEEKSTSDEEVDDMPNLPADSRGNTAHGFNLSVLNVGPLPPTPSSSDNEPKVEVDAASTKTPPPKRRLEGATESSLKVPKVEKGAKKGDVCKHAATSAKPADQDVSRMKL